jgi:hypothetical protein
VIRVYDETGKVIGTHDHKITRGLDNSTRTRGPKLRFRRRPPPHCFRLAARDTEIVRLLRYSPLGLADGLTVNLTRLRDRSDACNRRWRKTQQCERRV